MRRKGQSGVFLAFALMLAACVQGAGNGAQTTAVASGDLIAAAKSEYLAGHYAKAQSLAEKAATSGSDTAAALLIEAAALDRMKAFARADEIYHRLYPSIGKTAAFNNNYGYSLMLRGNLPMARKYLLLAQAAAPKSVTVNNNIDMLRNAGSYQHSD